MKKTKTIQISTLRKPTLEQFLQRHGLTLKIKEVAKKSSYYYNFEGSIKGLKIAPDQYRPSSIPKPRGKSPEGVIRMAELMIHGNFVEINKGSRKGPILLK